MLRNKVGLDYVEATDLSDIIVLAGPNGVGKTRLLRSLIDFFRSPKSDPDYRLVIDATSEHESKIWDGKSIDTVKPARIPKLRELLTKTQRRRQYRSTVLNFDSDRSISQIKPMKFTWDIPDPYEEDIGWDHSYQYLRQRHEDVQHSLFKLVEGQRRKIAKKAEQLKSSGQEHMPLDFDDPLAPFRAAFSQLLAPKKLIDADIAQQRITYEHEGRTFELATLSSGEREVINIAFDFILRNPSDCIIFFDEPELHLHPELSYKLLQTLQSIGRNNQFVFCTHSPEIITASIENSVIFLTPKRADGANQALVVSREDSTHDALNMLGQSIGIISLGRKLLLIEGKQTSLDKQTYGAILENEFPELVIVPIGGKGTARAFDDVRNNVLDRVIWGVEFFMLCDRDAAHDMGPNSLASHLSKRVHTLPYYHIENYFLDEGIIAKLFSEMEAEEDAWLRSASMVRERLQLFGKQSIPLAVALKVSAAIREDVGNIDVMPSGISQDTTVEALLHALRKRLDLEQARVAAALNFDHINRLARDEYAKLDRCVGSPAADWHRDIPGRIILNRFANAANLKVGRLKTLYIRHAKEAKRDPFADIRDIFRSMKNA